MGMHDRSDDLATLAVLTTTKAGQSVLSRDPDPVVVAALGHAWKLHPEVANDLVRTGRNRTASSRALRAVSDLDLLSTDRTQGSKLEWAARNPAAPVGLLERGLAAHLPEAACNQGAPEDLRRKYVTEKSTDLFAHKTGSTTYAVARNHELAVANSWALEAPGAAWAAHFRRGLSALPQASVDDLLKMGAGKIRNAKASSHPAAQGVDCSTAAVEDLLALNHPAADLFAVESERFEARHVAGLVRSQHAGGEAEEDPTLPHILGRAYNRFGPVLLRAIEAAPNLYKQWYRWPISGTRVKGAAWVAPGLACLELMSPWVFCEIEQADEVLGECLETWEVFVGLARQQDRGIPMLRVARAARRLVHGGSGPE